MQEVKANQFIIRTISEKDFKLNIFTQIKRCHILTKSKSASIRLTLSEVDSYFFMLEVLKYALSIAKFVLIHTSRLAKYR